MVWGGHEPKTESETMALCTLEFNDHAEIEQQTNGTTQGDSWGEQHDRTGTEHIDQRKHPHRQWPPRYDTDSTPSNGNQHRQWQAQLQCSAAVNSTNPPPANGHSIVAANQHCTASTTIEVEQSSSVTKRCIPFVYSTRGLFTVE